MRIDLPTLYLVTTFATTVSGLMLLFAWSQDRSATTLAWWGSGFLVLVAGGILLALRGVIPDRLSIMGGNSLWFLAHGLMWCGARVFAGRTPRLEAAAAGTIVWLVACSFDAFLADVIVRVHVFTIIYAAYVGLIAWEYWRERNDELTSRWPMIVIQVFQAAFVTLRIPFAESIVFPLRIDGPLGLLVPISLGIMLLHYYCSAFLVMAMAKERQELRYRRAAQIDPLTGIANRRAFFERGEPLLRRTQVDGRPVALLVLDLDFFKHINDTFGHQTGDRVLCAFCDTVAALLRPTDLFGRTGGEEFACLLPGASAAVAIEVAERIRARFEGRPATAGHLGTPSTVSVGVATTNDTVGDLAALMAAADRALYRAKANGRNRVEASAVPQPEFARPLNTAA
jgi:diguanylate cyclase (GGDEF)-like protein